MLEARTQPNDSRQRSLTIISQKVRGLALTAHWKTSQMGLLYTSNQQQVYHWPATDFCQNKSCGTVGQGFACLEEA